MSFNKRKNFYTVHLLLKDSLLGNDLFSIVTFAVNEAPSDVAKIITEALRRTIIRIQANLSGGILKSIYDYENTGSVSVCDSDMINLMEEAAFCFKILKAELSKEDYDKIEKDSIMGVLNDLFEITRKQVISKFVGIFNKLSEQILDELSCEAVVTASCILTAEDFVSKDTLVN